MRLTGLAALEGQWHGLGDPDEGIILLPAPSQDGRARDKRAAPGGSSPRVPASPGLFLGNGGLSPERPCPGQ